MSSENERELDFSGHLSEDERVALAVIALAISLALIFFWTQQSNKDDLLSQAEIIATETTDVDSAATAAESERDRVQITSNQVESGVVELSGVGTPGDTLAIYQGNKQIGTAKVDRNGYWSYTTALASAGLYDLSVQSRDDNSIDRLQLSLGDDDENAVVDEKTAPSEPTAAPDQATDEQGTAINFENILDINGEASPSDDVNILVDGNNVGTATTSADGTWGLAIPYEAITVGRNEIEARMAATNALIFSQTVNRAEPAATTILDGYDGLTRPLSQFANSKVTGEGQPNWLIAFQIDDRPARIIDTDANGRWEAPSTFAEAGEYTISVWSVDTDGNIYGRVSDQAVVTITQD